MRQLPLLGSLGVFTLLPPFTITNVNYRCASLQLISTLVDSGTDVFTTYYAPYSIPNSAYQTDLNNGSAIVTLESVDGPTIIVPSSFIDTMPVEMAVPYSRMVVSVELGELPDDLVLTQLLSDIQTIANNYVGVSSTPRLHKIQSPNHYSHAEYLLKEIQRKALVQQYVSFYTGKTESDHKLLLAEQKILDLEAAIIALQRLIP